MRPTPPPAVLALAGDLLGGPAEVVGRLAGGETGAYEVCDRNRRRFVLKWSDQPSSFAAREEGTRLTALLGDAGWPVPRHWMVTDGGLQVVAQELVAGEPLGPLSHRIVDQLVGWHQRRKGLAPAGSPDGVVPELRKTLVTGGDGYCRHDALAATRARWRRPSSTASKRWGGNGNHRVAGETSCTGTCTPATCWPSAAAARR